MVAFPPHRQHIPRLQADTATTGKRRQYQVETNMFKDRPGSAARLLIVASSMLIFAACASGPNIRSDYDQSMDFGNYSTYNFFADAGPDSTSYQGLFTQYMITAIDREMQSRGYKKSDNPDLLVNFNANFQDKTKVTTTPSMGGYYGYRGGYYGAWGGYGYGTDTHVSQYTEGTFNIDLVDAKRKQLVWEAVAVGRIRDDTFDNLQQKVDEGVPQFFASYPFVAGESMPVAPGEK